MSTEVFMRGFFTFILSAVLAYVVYSRSSEETAWERESKGLRYAPYIAPELLPIFLAVVAIMSMFHFDSPTTLRLLFSLCFGVFLHIAIYYLILLLLLPLLRRFISARACALLWLLPNFLYFTQQAAMELERPRWILTLPDGAAPILLAVWLTGFALVLGWYLISHLLFRHRILRDARDVMSLQTRNLWIDEQHTAGFKKANYKLVVSPAVNTPLSIGLFRWSTRVVLPERNYTEEELKLIFRHEIIHISRDDSGTKFFMVFCTAMCWFNPLMWIAMRRSADDLELSCDETVLARKGEFDRRRYADLLLRTAGDDRGFTTSLSASARAMRYRLKNVMSPRKRFAGGITVGLIFFVLMMSCGYVSLAYDSGSGQEFLFQNRDSSAYRLENVSFRKPEGWSSYTCSDPEALDRYLRGLTFSQITGNYSFPTEEYGLSMMYQDLEGGLIISTLTDHTLIVTKTAQNRLTNNYYCTDSIDWAYLESLLERIPESPLPHPPNLMLHFDGLEPDDPLYAQGQIIWRKVGDEYISNIRNDTFEEMGVGGIYGYEATEVRLEFTHPLRDGYQVEVYAEGGDGDYMYSVHSTELDEEYVLPLAPYSAEYRITAQPYDTFDDEEYSMEYRFEVILPEDQLPSA